MSTDLQWLLIRKNNSYLVKRTAEGPIFSKEPGNLVNIHSQKYSGLANARTIDVRPSSNGIAITHRNGKASPHAVRSAYATNVIGSRTGPRRALRIAAQPAKRSYRSDLRVVSTSVSIFFFVFSSFFSSNFAFSLEPTGDAIRRHEGWAWTCLQDKSLLRRSRSNSSVSLVIRYRMSLDIGREHPTNWR
jgi:large subunit ribosomal protein L28e